MVICYLLPGMIRETHSRKSVSIEVSGRVSKGTEKGLIIRVIWLKGHVSP